MGQYRQARAFWDEARLQYQQTVLQAFHEVRRSFTPGRNTRKRACQRVRSVAAYQDAVLVATERYRAGHANYLDILDAQQELFPDENALARTQLNQLLIIVSLYKSLGGGWNQPETAAPARVGPRYLEVARTSRMGMRATCAAPYGWRCQEPGRR